MLFDADVRMFTAGEGEQKVRHKMDRDQDTALKQFPRQDLFRDLLLETVPDCRPVPDRDLTRRK